ncbi:ATP-binding cassette domain-containing protein [Pseudooceanicola sp. GBMRC 2024]|uniref:ATP-binding cassette domain-containing protein n=1 Tax=Pseudooceanicola albus TaxID=2692189 RepID=A0A6L7G5B7_9RHOB|nr:ATP-binding cassette domain-containing protein [Pseudooceanicola albus]
MLGIRDLEAWYGKSHILHGVTLDVRRGEIVSLLGRNGAGRSTLLKAVMGAIRTTGRVDFAGTDLVGRKPHQIAHAGIGYVPESRDVFPELTVRENLILGLKPGGEGRWSLEEIYDLFPVLRTRADTRAGALSGGEQQMLTICRTLIGDPELIMVDEPTEGLAPKMVAAIGTLLERIAARGVSILLVEQKLVIALDISHRVYVMGHGEIVFEGTPAALMQSAEVRAEWLEV